MIKKIIWVFLISILPVIELRGGIPTGYLAGVPWWFCLPAAILGNLLPVPFILSFIPKILAFMNHHNILPKITGWVERKAQRGVEKLQASSDKNEDENKKIPWGACIALFAFVAIPLPGTGAWTGALIASFFGMKKRIAFPVIALGVIAAATVVAIVFYGGIEALQKLF